MVCIGLSTLPAYSYMCIHLVVMFSCTSAHTYVSTVNAAVQSASTVVTVIGRVVLWIGKYMYIAVAPWIDGKEKVEVIPRQFRRLCLS